MTVAAIREAVPGWDGKVTCSGTRHPLTDFDSELADRLFARLAELGGAARISPDLAHMLVEGRPGAATQGYGVICDAGLPPNSVVAL